MKKQIIIDGKKTIYIVTSEGQIFNSITQKELKGTLQRNEYRTVQLTIEGKPKSLMVHRLVAEAFVPNPENLNIVDHIDGNKMNNDYSNLRWVDNKTNANNVKIREKSTAGKKFQTSSLDLINEWKVIDQNYPQYRINKNGEIINLKTNKYILGSNRNGYLRFSIGEKRYSIHRLVWEIFKGEIPENMVIDHMDGNRSNNKLENLKLTTQSENMRNAQKNGHKGQKKVLQYDLEGNMIKEFDSLTAAGESVGVTYAAISSAIKRSGSCRGFKWSFKN